MMQRHFQFLKFNLIFQFGLLVSLGTFQVMQRQFLRTGITLGSFKLDVATVMSQQGTLPISKPWLSCLSSYGMELQFVFLTR